jgi:hypothetical protein
MPNAIIDKGKVQIMPSPNGSKPTRLIKTMTMPNPKNENQRLLTALREVSNACHGLKPFSTTNGIAM